MKISYPYGTLDEISDPHVLDFSLKTELGQGFSIRRGELSFVLELTSHRMIIIPEGGSSPFRENFVTEGFGSKAPNERVDIFLAEVSSIPHLAP